MRTVVVDGEERRIASLSPKLEISVEFTDKAAALGYRLFLAAHYDERPLFLLRHLCDVLEFTNSDAYILRFDKEDSYERAS